MTVLRHLGLALLVVPFLALIDTGFIPGPMLFAGIALTAATAYRDRADTPVQTAVNVTLVPTTGVELLDVTLQEIPDGGGPDCQLTLMVVTEFAPLLLAVTE